MKYSVFFLVCVALFVVAGLGVSFWVNVVHADETPEKLFDGKTLDGWQVLKCEAEVVDGCILIKSGDGVLATERQYADYVLEYEWKALAEDKWDSGVYVRCELPAEGRPWPERYQLNLDKGQEGALPGVASTVTNLCKDREWNHFKFTVKGNVGRLEINGQPAWTYDKFQQPEGYICLQAEVKKGGQFLFRNITIREIE